ncbi:MAG: hypothetical protein E4H16_02655 [Candidatus Atribacteria bacterium]|nr:MAG: hypothetical protein E4H16_02655 [Candidatus Atribacteria bacterium]
MRKPITLILVLLMLLLSIQISYAQGIGVIIDNTSVVFDTNTGTPFIDGNSRALVPFRVVLEKFGCKVEWNQIDKIAKAQKSGIVVQVPIGKPFILINGVEKANDTSAQIKNGRTYLPIRAVLEAFGASVSWNQSTNSVVADSSGMPVINPALDGMQKTIVKRVIDGDTIIIDSGEHVRLIGVDTPEKEGPYTNSEYYGEEATAYTKRILSGKTIYLAKDISETDKYGRLLRSVYLEDGTFFNLQLIKEGYANIATFPPDVKYVDLFRKAETIARESGKGLWGK